MFASSASILMFLSVLSILLTGQLLSNRAKIKTSTATAEMSVLNTEFQKTVDLDCTLPFQDLLQIIISTFSSTRINVLSHESDLIINPTLNFLYLAHAPPVLS